MTKARNVLTRKLDMHWSRYSRLTFQKSTQLFVADFRAFLIGNPVFARERRSCDIQHDACGALTRGCDRKLESPAAARRCFESEIPDVLFEIVNCFNHSTPRIDK